MKILCTFSALFLLFFNISTSKTAIILGLDIWMKTLIPALFPFMVISNIIINLNLENLFSILLYPVTRFLRINRNCGYVIFSGLLFGLPLCSLTAFELYNKGKISKSEANYCINCFNGISPGFLLCIITGSNKTSLILFYYLSIIILALVNKKFIKIRSDFIQINHNNIIVNQNKYILKIAIKAAIYNIEILGGYILIFTLLNYWIISYFQNFGIYLSLLIELSSGVILGDLKANIILPFAAFGGISGVLQTFAVDDNEIIDKKKYLISKILHAIILIPGIFLL